MIVCAVINGSATEVTAVNTGKAGMRTELIAVPSAAFLGFIFHVRPTLSRVFSWEVC